MTSYHAETRRWMWVAIVCGLATVTSYVVATQIPVGLSLRSSYLIFICFGPLFCTAILAFHMFLRVERSSVALHIGTLLLLIGGAINTVMAAMQGSLRLYFDKLPHDDSVAEATRTAWRMALHAGNALQLGADVAWDAFVLSGLVVWGFAFIRHPRFGPWFGWSAVAVGAGGLVLNACTFPMPPAEEGLFDGGPLVGLWFTATTIQLIRLLRMGRPALSDARG